MQIAVRFDGLPSRPATVDWVQRRVHFSLDRHEHAIRKLVVTVGDANGPRGGTDQRCVVHLRLRSGGAPLVVRALEENLTQAVSKALERARRRLTRRLDTRASTAA